jgi:serine/threonine protein kinase
MNNLERLTVETGRDIQQRYLLQRLVRRGQICAVYQGFDQVLQRAVAVKAAPAEHTATYRAALRLTSQFSHPHIIGIYDLIIEPDTVYLVQEYVDGDDFNALLQTQLTPYQVAEAGMQICRALLYAGSPSRKVCHGDLTPSSVLRDRRGQIRINNFALPSDLNYFNGWSVVGGDGTGLADAHVPWGQLTEERLADDARAVGLLLYQLLTARAPGSVSVEPPSDGRLRFQRNVPPELCNIVARSVVRQHPQYIASAEALFNELKPLADAMEPPIMVAPSNMPVAAEQMRSQPFSQPLMSGPLAGTAVRETSGHTGMGAPFTESNAPFTGMDGALPIAPAAATVADLPAKLATARQAAYSQVAPGSQQRRLNLPVLIGLGLVLFAIFFIIGFFLSRAVLH